jgi:hypothetical protein
MIKSSAMDDTHYIPEDFGGELSGISLIGSKIVISKKVLRKKNKLTDIKRFFKAITSESKQIFKPLHQ